MDWLHALAASLLIGANYLVVEKSGRLEGKSIGQKLLILLPLSFVGVLLLNLLWPGDWPH